MSCLATGDKRLNCFFRPWLLTMLLLLLLVDNFGTSGWWREGEKEAVSCLGRGYQRLKQFFLSLAVFWPFLWLVDFGASGWWREEGEKEAGLAAWGERL